MLNCRCTLLLSSHWSDSPQVFVSFKDDDRLPSFLKCLKLHFDASYGLRHFYVIYLLNGKLKGITSRYWLNIVLEPRVSSKQSNFFFGSNRNKPKLNLFRLFFGLFRETKKYFFGLFRFVLVFWTGIETTETNRIFSKQTEKISKKRFLLGGPRNR
jgi:hypothetical protein